jgi:hypothetical protein
LETVVYRVQGSVQDQQVWPVDQGSDDRQPGFLPARTDRQVLPALQVFTFEFDQIFPSLLQVNPKILFKPVIHKRVLTLIDDLRRGQIAPNSPLELTHASNSLSHTRTILSDHSIDLPRLQFQSHIQKGFVFQTFAVELEKSWAFFDCGGVAVGLLEGLLDLAVVLAGYLYA